MLQRHPVSVPNSGAGVWYVPQTALPSWPQTTCCVAVSTGVQAGAAGRRRHRPHGGHRRRLGRLRARGGHSGGRRRLRVLGGDRDRGGRSGAPRGRAWRVGHLRMLRMCICMCRRGARRGRGCPRAHVTGERGQLGALAMGPYDRHRDESHEQARDDHGQRHRPLLSIASELGWIRSARARAVRLAVAARCSRNAGMRTRRRSARGRAAVTVSERSGGVVVGRHGLALRGAQRAELGR